MTQGEALNILKMGANVFLTGEPGSGKTHTINAYVAWLRSCGIEPSITAATGIAATHVGGMTIHSWSGIGVTQNITPADVDRIAGKEHIARRILKAKVLIIEEVSMLSADTFAGVDAICQEVRRDERPFGGLIVVLVGDFFQLPPIARRSFGPHQTEDEPDDAIFAYTSPSWRELNPIVCYLTEQHRQDDDTFLGILSAIRTGEVDQYHYEQLLTRETEEAFVPEDAPKLYTHNADVDRINAAALAKLPSTAKKFLMTSKGREALVDGLKRGCLSPEVLELKEGATVMFTKNSPQGKFVNGTLGTVIEFERGTGMPIVETRQGGTVTAEPMEWQVEEQGTVRASVAQVPLRLAYAMTVHKSQGLSMDAAVIDLSRAFEYGQGYVALSRVRRLDGVYLLGMGQRALQVHPAILEADGRLRGASEAAAGTFGTLPAEEIEELQKKFVKAMGGAWKEPSTAATSESAPKGLQGRLAQTLQAARDAHTLKEVAKVRGLTVSTIVKHLEELAEAGALVRKDIAHLLPAGSAFSDIQEAIDGADETRLTPIYTALGGRYSFEEIRLVRLTRAYVRA